MALYCAVSVRRIGRELRLQRRLLLGDVAQAGLQTLIDGGEQPAGPGVAVDQVADLRRDAVGAAEQIADRGEVGAQGIAERGRHWWHRLPIGAGRDAEVGQRVDAAGLPLA